MTRITGWCLLSWLVSALFGGVHAAPLDQGEVTFSGYIVDEGPRWLWQLASPDQVWDVNTDDARLDARGWQVFDLSGQTTLPFLQGHLRKVATRGGAGMTPTVSFAADGAPLSLAAGPGGNRTAIAVKDVETGEAIGQLAFTLEQALVVAQGQVTPNADSHDRHLGLTGMALVAEGAGQAVSAGLASTLTTLMTMNEGYQLAGIPLTLNGEQVPRQVLADNRVPLLGGAYASQLSDFELSWPQEQVPSQWRATLSVSVTIQ